MPKAKDEEPTEKAKDKKLTDQDKFKQVKKDIREKMLEILKMVDMEERFTIALRDKQPKNYIQEYPDRTICGCDGEVYNMLMNWAYKHKIANHLALDQFVEVHGRGLDKIKQRPKSADRASARYWKTNAKKGNLGKEKAKGKGKKS
uniref:Uncharacterized protein n=1 Tax=Candidatus Kentrum sp. SD TaxID=2126332 RepID=A0A450YDR0_9GAMM|nr:MAG: hypothetical protein BECKSD772F_GA0070984_104617 [Candidatus Kentron sp. SD]VFK47141.1 MAG: hypothetical protein BECKSD772E_GA0070983_108811 [Candidatus Kentron sp. SD]VFK81152.1 MAG: hypothetical protein BECKSD772D_GA0070982_12363 [Candidatus Kentron sp. SD]